ncbi:MAG: fibronectin type III domain-containing protein, partial [Pseudomonadota bacterium]|nr:fibronectin type III domain-containing protein [Pseudomonadota bacterium]
GSGSASLTSNGGDDMVFIKLNKSGDLTFAKSLGGTSTDRASAVAVDGLGSIHLAGAYSGTADFDPGSGTNNLTSGGSTDIFLGKYDNDGSFDWAKGLGGSSSDYGNAITVDGNRNVYATGFFQDSADLDGDGITDIDGTGNREIFIIKYNAAGEVDKTAPLITGVSLAADNSTIAVTFSERVYGTSSGGSALQTSDFVFSLSGGVATLAADTATSISISGNTATLGFSLAGTASGGETLTVNPKRDSVYDGSGNVAAEDQSNNSVTLNDQTGPEITAMTISDDNSTVSVTLSETAYSTNGGSGDLEVNDFAFSLTGGIATLASPFPTTISASGTTITLGLSITGTADGNEQLTVLPATNSLYDATGNVASTTQTNNSAYLTDKTAPSAPTSLSANGDNQQVTLSWTVSSDLDVAKYYIYSGTSASPTTMTDSTVGRTNASKLITGLTNGTTYYFRVSAVDSTGLESAKSADASA